MKAELIPRFAFGFVISVLMFSGLVFAQGLQDVISTLKDIGVFQFYLPFIISFAVLFGLLEKIKIFGDKGKQLNIIVALAVSAYVMVYTPVGITLSQFFTNLFGNAIVVILTIVVVAMFATVLNAGTGDKFKLDKLFEGRNIWIAILLFGLLALGVFVASGGTAIFPGLKISTKELFSPIKGIFGLSSTTLALVILIVGTGLIVWLFAKEPKPTAGAGQGQGQPR